MTSQSDGDMLRGSLKSMDDKLMELRNEAIWLERDLKNDQPSRFAVKMLTGLIGLALEAVHDIRDGLT